MAFAQWRFICATPTPPILSVWPGMSSTTFHDPASQSCEGPCSKCPGGWSLRALKLPRHSSWHFPNLRWFERLGQGCFGPWYTARFVLKVWFQPAIMTPAETWIDQITSNIHQITTYPELVILQVHRLMLAACCLLRNIAQRSYPILLGVWSLWGGGPRRERPGPSMLKLPVRTRWFFDAFCTKLGSKLGIDLDRHWGGFPEITSMLFQKGKIPHRHQSFCLPCIPWLMVVYPAFKTGFISEVLLSITKATILYQDF